MTPLAIISFARSHWKLIGIGLLALFAGIQTLRLAWTQTALEKLTTKIAVMAAVTAETDKRWRATENTWKVTAYQIQKERDDEIKDIAHERDAALAELRNRPRRPAPAPPKPPAMDKLPADVLEHNYTETMRSFLSGKLPTPTN